MVTVSLDMWLGFSVKLIDLWLPWTLRGNCIPGNSKVVFLSQ